MSVSLTSRDADHVIRISIYSITIFSSPVLVTMYVFGVCCQVIHKPRHNNLPSYIVMMCLLFAVNGFTEAR